MNTKLIRLKKAGLYQTWCDMRRRVYNKNCKDYIRYGGRGIKICKRWDKFKNFFKDMGDKWFVGATIDRIDVHGNYSPKNCKWSTRAQQSLNKTNSVRFLFSNKLYTAQQLAAKLNLPLYSIYNRYKGIKINKK